MMQGGRHLSNLAGGAGCLIIAIIGLFQFVAGAAGLHHALGGWGLFIVTLISLPLGLQFPFMIGTYICCVNILHWPWPLGILCAAPGVIFLLPAVILDTVTFISELLNIKKERRQAKAIKSDSSQLPFREYTNSLPDNLPHEVLLEKVCDEHKVRSQSITEKEASEGRQAQIEHELGINSFKPATMTDSLFDVKPDISPKIASATDSPYQTVQSPVPEPARTPPQKKGGWASKAVYLFLLLLVMAIGKAIGRNVGESVTSGITGRPSSLKTYPRQARQANTPTSSLSLNASSKSISDSTREWAPKEAESKPSSLKAVSVPSTKTASVAPPVIIKTSIGSKDVFISQPIGSKRVYDFHQQHPDVTPKLLFERTDRLDNAITYFSFNEIKDTEDMEFDDKEIEIFIDEIAQGFSSIPPSVETKVDSKTPKGKNISVTGKGNFTIIDKSKTYIVIQSDGQMSVGKSNAAIYIVESISFIGKKVCHIVVTSIYDPKSKKPDNLSEIAIWRRTITEANALKESLPSSSPGTLRVGPPPPIPELSPIPQAPPTKRDQRLMQELVTFD